MLEQLQSFELLASVLHRYDRSQPAQARFVALLRRTAGFRSEAGQQQCCEGYTPRLCEEPAVSFAPRAAPGAAKPTAKKTH